MSSLHRRLMKNRFEESQNSPASLRETIPSHQDRGPRATTMSVNTPSPEPTTGYWSDSSASSSSPMIRQHNWPTPTSSDDEDDDDDDFDWDAGITDFTLYSSDRNKSIASGHPIDTKWASFVAGQADALQRAVLRRRRSDSSLRSHTSEDEASAHRADSVPALTPDASPELRDNMDDEQQYYHPTPRFPAPSTQGTTDCKPQGYISVIVEPPARLFSALDYESRRTDDISEEEEDDDDFDDDEPPLEFYIHRHLEGRHQRKVQRPGLWGSRTLSGKLHSWRRPSWHLHPVIEDREEEG
ncbi:hypothetical protein K431DRAFT_291020 [Polychaeton citri CBS 116435]|uniref:Uncharacterized protein n=1 Tax=Polychaeton citri CBS 116435 TaxID=1314669 RepID=A0A9P4UST6_9PEZI|nr:hypothetical protein K431DRAFT_291020 [Polychaeton citri CBS 116435]